MSALSIGTILLLNTNTHAPPTLPFMRTVLIVLSVKLKTFLNVFLNSSI